MADLRLTTVHTRPFLGCGEKLQDPPWFVSVASQHRPNRFICIPSALERILTELPSGSK